ncbi:MAG: isoprenyl transferase, partial [bacterium]
MCNKEYLQDLDVLKREILSSDKIPEHVAIIMDGNGRWAKQRQLSRVEGHKEGINSVREIVRAAGELGIKYLTLYTFSTENWKRPELEVSALMSLLLQTIRDELDELNRNNVKLQTIGHLEDLPFLPRRGLLHAMKVLRQNSGLTLNLALSYSSRREIMDAVKKIVAAAIAGQVKPDDVNEALIENHLYTAQIPDPDLLVRTSGELRISNFLLWQLAYTEIYVTQLLWPDFRQLEFFKAIRAYQNRERRFG